MAKKKVMTSSPGASEFSAWQTQIIPTGPTIVSGTEQVDAASTTIGVNKQLQALYNMTKAERSQIAQALKSAGYSGFPTNGLYNNALAAAYTNAIMMAQTNAANFGLPFDQTFFVNYLTEEALARSAMGGGKGPRITEQESVITKSDAKDLINAIIRDKDGRAASASEIEKYTALIQKRAAKNPTVTRTETVGGKTIVKTQPGFGIQEAQSFLLDRISGTDEAKANKVLGYYETFLNALGGR